MSFTIAGSARIIAALSLGCVTAQAAESGSYGKPYQYWLPLACSAGECGKPFPKVPAKHWLEIKSVSCLFDGRNASAQPTSVRAEITDGTSNTIRLSEEITPEPQFEGGYNYVVNQETFIVAYGGQRPFIRADYVGQMDKARCKIAGELLPVLENGAP